MESIIPRCAGIDVHKVSVEVCSRVLDQSSRLSTNLRDFPTTTGDLRRLRDWLKSLGVTHVAMESTGVYWKPIFNILEEEFTVLLCNARHIKNVPGRKTDAKDCQWIAQLLQHGLLNGSFIPPRAQRDLRDLTRQRAQLVGEKTRVINRIEKILEDANIKLSSVASDTLGVSGREMIRSIISGKDDPKELAQMARRRLKAKIPELRQALEGHVTEHHRFMLGKMMTHLDFLEREIGDFDQQIEKRTLGPELSPPESATPEGEESQDNEPSSCRPPMTFAAAIAALDAVPGIDVVSASAILAEIGADMSHFPTHKHLNSWARICPGNNESGGKRKNGSTGKANRWLRPVLIQCAWAATHTKDTYFSAQYRQMAKRRGKKRALVALAHTLLTVFYHILKYHEDYRELGGDFYDKIDPERKTRYFIKRLKELGHSVILEPQDDAA